MKRHAAPLGEVPVRTAYAAHLRRRYEHRPLLWRHFGRVVDQLEGPEPVVVPWWTIREFALGVRNPDAGGVSAFVRLEPDDTVNYVEAVKDGVQIVEWRVVRLGPR